MTNSGATIPLPSAARRVLIAPDKFKGSLTAREVASAVAAGLRHVNPTLEADICPIADGGEGTLDAAILAGFQRVPTQVEGPTGEKVFTAFAQRDGVALIELAEASGLQRLVGKRFAPLTASTYGTGQLVSAALSTGNRTIVLGIGGSASSDGGAGLVQALGAHLLDANGIELRRGGQFLIDVAQIDLKEMKERLAGARFIIASDVESPLLGPQGAATVFGPQKGASPEQIRELERGLSRWASVVARVTGTHAAEQSGAGAAGGVGFGAIALLNASIVGGADMVLDLVRFPDRARNVDLVITGEGSLDEQTLFGKAPIRVAAASQSLGIPAVAVAGQCTVSEKQLAARGIRRVYTLTKIEPDVSRSIANASLLLEQMGRYIAESELSL